LSILIILAVDILKTSQIKYDMFALNIALALNLIILFVAFFFRKNNTFPNKVLALILLDTAISFLGNATIVGGYFSEFPYLFFLSWCTSSFFGPLFFTYTCLFTGAGLKFSHPIWISGIVIGVFGLSFPLNYVMLEAGEFYVVFAAGAFALADDGDQYFWDADDLGRGICFSVEDCTV
jgi:hypothetical protein